ncbi:alpha/beta hydrolase [Pyramidobacter sp.]|uniref:alpha/beta fold hydrolase n=2 Tax=Pyramidobacter sp. TaxID=1943581 RepID=UPI002A75FF94|nr:alpha/beta hydrolase [Pyramidobacter sp.]MDY3213268.1 alpha/beta hydrolase [Pyramidobacter sp.]
MTPNVPLLLLPGLAGGADCWGQPFLAALRRAGATPLLYAPPRDYSFARAVAAAAAQIERRGAPCAVLGWSMGAEVALRLALERPELVASLVLCAACADQAASAQRNAALRELLEAPWPRWHELLMRAVMPQSLRERPAAALNFMRLTAARRTPDDALLWNAQREALKAAPPLNPVLPRIKQPALVCAGEHDLLFPPEEVEKLAAALPDARFRLFPAGHAVMYDCPEELAQTIAAFLAAVV